jgi:kanamycin kinase
MRRQTASPCCISRSRLRIELAQTGAVIARRPTGEVAVPDAVRPVIGTLNAEIVWRNELGGLTFELTDSTRRRFVKWAPAGSGLDLGPEIDRLHWLEGRWPAPRVLDAGGDESGSWLMTSAVPGENAVTDRWRNDPVAAVRAIGEGLRAMHDALPVQECPFSWGVQVRYEVVRRRAADGLIDPADWHEEHQCLQPAEALALLATPPPVERLVVCHGDPCAPNTLIGPDGRWTGHVDFGALGIADRWADLAVAAWSAEWNYGPGWGEPLLAAYGVARDDDRSAYYRLLWDLD